MEWDRTKHQSKETVRDRKEEDSGGEMNTGRVHVFHHAICEALINVSLSLQRRLLAETLRLVLSHPLPPPSSPSWVPLSLPTSSSSADTIPPPRVATSRNVSRLQVTVRKLWGVNSAESEILFTEKKKQNTMCVCVCWCVPTAFNVMLIQFIFNEETVSSYREAKEISGLLHSGKSIVHLFILLFELFVCLKKKNKKNTNRRDTLPR